VKAQSRDQRRILNDLKRQIGKFLLKKFLSSTGKVKRTLFPNLNLGRIPHYKAFSNYLVSMAKSSFVDNVHGHKMYLDESDILGLSWSGIYEPYQTRFFQSRVSRGHVVLDIGAHIGYYTLIFARQVGVAGHVFAFEPEPQNFALLSKNVDINAYTNVTLVNKAVSDNTGKLRLFISEVNKGDHRTYDPHDGRGFYGPHNSFIEVESIRLDDYFAGFNREVNFVKMDIQGAEYCALKGMASLLEKSPSVVLVTEFWPYGLALSGLEPQAFLELIMEIGFKICYVDEKDGTIQRANIQELLDICTPENRHFVSLVCKRL
jgi:FkbM family methyltransferase